MGMSLGTVLSGVVKGFLAALPFLRRGKAEYEAGANPSTAEKELADELINGALRRLGAITPGDQQFQRIFSNVIAVAVRPEHFSKPYVRNWLSLSSTRESLSELAKAKLISAKTPLEHRESLINSYIEISGEHRALAEDCVTIAVAFIKSSMQAAALDAGGAAISQVGFSSVHTHLDEVSQSLGEFTEELSSTNREQTESIRSLASVITESTKSLQDIQGEFFESKKHAEALEGKITADYQIIEAEAWARLEAIIKSRFFIGFDSEQSVRQLLSSLEGGDIARVSNAVKSEIYAWCARLLADIDIQLAESLIEKGVKLDSNEYLDIARAFARAKNGDAPSAIASLANIETPLSRSAALIIVNKYQGSMAAYHWLNGAGITSKDLDPDGKVVAVNVFMENKNWAAALELVGSLVDSDFTSAPALSYLSAQLHLVQVVPSELHHLVLQSLPFETAEFPLAGNAAAINHRNKAIEFYEKTVELSSQLGLTQVANLSADSALWLSLRDHEKRKAAIAELESSMRTSKHSLRRLPLALQFNLNIDLIAVEREIERQTALSSGKSTDAAVARLALALRQGTPEKFLEYFDRHREQLSAQLNPKAMAFYEIEMLVRSEQISVARERIKLLTSEQNTDLSEIDKVRLTRLVDEAAGVDPVEQRLSIYEMSGSLGDLHILVDALIGKGDWHNLAAYAEILFNKTRDLSDFTTLVKSLFNSGALERTLELLDEHPVFIQQSEKIKSLKCLVLYELGYLSAATELLNELRKENDSEEHRQLTVSIAITSGDWESLDVFVENEWAARDKRSAEDLLKVARLAEHIQSKRLKELVFEVARKEPTDATILIGCYYIATESGWESDVEVSSWLKTAALNSSENGPVQKITLHELLERQPAWENRESEVWRLHAEGKLPFIAVANFLNRSFFSLYTLPALTNDNIPDARKRSPIYTFSGTRRTAQIGLSTIAFDATSLLTLQMLGLTQQAFDTFREIVIPHGLLRWLFEERQRIPFHQPSKVLDASEIRRYISDGSLRIFESTTTPESDISMEVGEVLASMLSEAKFSHDNKGQCLVVRSNPVYKVGSLVQERADLENYEEYLCSCTAIVEELTKRGALTTAKADECKAYLSLNEHPWPKASIIESSAKLILDDVSVSYFQHLGILQKISRAGFTVYISTRELEEADTLIEYDNQASNVIDLVDRLRITIRDGIFSGKVKLNKMSRGGSEDSEGLKQNPFFDLMSLSHSVEFVATDDRFINQHPYISAGEDKNRIATSLDIIYSLQSAGKISKHELFESLTKLRRFGMAFVPLGQEELSYYLDTSKLEENVFLEGAELKAIRESYLRVVMTEALLAPQELTWLNEFLENCMEALKSLWYENCEESSAVAKSNWLLEILDIRKLAHIYRESTEMTLERYALQVVVLMIAPVGVSIRVRDMYWKWCENRILLPLKYNDPALYSKIVEKVSYVMRQELSSEIKPGEEASQ